MTKWFVGPRPGGREVSMTRWKLLMASVGVVWVLTSGAAADGSEKRGCREIDAEFTSEIDTANCTSPLGLCAAGAIRHDALLKGTMFVTITDAAPSAGMPNSEPPTLLSVSGVRTLSPRRGGTLTAHVVGVFDTAAGSFAELNVITAGTGRFSGATGTLHVAGRGIGPTTFGGEITGVMCLP
jgi:hypothetical protein